MQRFAKQLEDENIEGEPNIKAKLKSVCNEAKGKDNRFVSSISANYNLLYFK